MRETIIAPWTKEQVEYLNRWQQSGLVHPYTCGGNRTDEKHLDGEGILVATENGWICPFCDYKQNWAHNPDNFDFTSTEDWLSQIKQANNK